MRRRSFLAGAALGVGSNLRQRMAFAAQEPPPEHRLPETDADYRRSRSYVEEVPVSEYHWASDRACEAFRDIKFGVRIHWGLYSIIGNPGESWPFLKLNFAERARYNEMYKTWNPKHFDADSWLNLFQESGMKMLAFTTRHHEGFSMFDTRTHVHRRTNWLAAGGPKVEACDLAYSIMETPFRRDVVKEICAAAQKRQVKVDLYFSHSDWYDADFRPYGYHPLQCPSSAELQESGLSGEQTKRFWQDIKTRIGTDMVMTADPSPPEARRMVERHRAQIRELLTNYGRIDMMCLDIWWGPRVWPQLRQTLLEIRKLQPDVMLRARGIGNYGDYYTPEGFVPNSKANTEMPWFVIYPLGSSFSYEKDPSKYKGSKWIVQRLIDTVAKGGNFMVGVGPDGEGSFDPVAAGQLREAGAWLKVNGEGIYGTRPRPGDNWREGETIRYTRSKGGDAIYCFLLDWPGRTLSLKSIEGVGAPRVELLGAAGQSLACRRDSALGLVIDLPESWQDPSKRPCQYAWGLRISRTA